MSSFKIRHDWYFLFIKQSNVRNLCSKWSQLYLRNESSSLLGVTGLHLASLMSTNRDLWYFLNVVSLIPAHGKTHNQCWYAYHTQGQFWPSGIVVARVCLLVCMCVCVCVYKSPACPRDNSGPVQARIIKFGPKMQNTLFKVPIVIVGNWRWPSSQI